MPISRTIDKKAPLIHDSYSGLSTSRKTITMVGVLMALMLSALDQTIVGTALPTIVRDLGGATHYTWVVTAYLLASTVTVPIYGKLSDLFGRKWFFFSGIVLFLIGSVLCGLSGSLTQLIIFRAIQGIGGGAIMGNAFAIVGDLFPPAERGKWQGAMGGVFGLASVIGPALGGYLTDNASWRWVFYVNVPLGLIALAFIGLRMPRVRSLIVDKTIDYVGAILLTTTLVPLLLALSFGGNSYAWGSAQIIGLVFLGVISLIGFILIEHRVRQPILPLDLFTNRTFSISAVITFLTAAALFGAIIYIPLFAQLVLGTSATDSGTILTPLMVGLIGSSIISGQLISRTGKYKALALIGLIALMLGLLWLGNVSPVTTQLGLVMRMVVTGIGLGLTTPIFNIAVQNAFPANRIGVVTAATQLFRSVGGVVGTAVLGSLFNNSLTSRGKALTNTDFARLIHSLAHSPLATSFDAKLPRSAGVTFSTLASSAKLQIVLSSVFSHALSTGFAQIPAPLGQRLVSTFSAFEGMGKVVFARSVDAVFLVGALIAGIALIIGLALPELPLRRTQKAEEPKSEAVGIELATDFGQASSADVPLPDR